MRIRVINAQRECPVNAARMGRLARRAVRFLRIRTLGMLTVTFIDSRRMRALNRRFLRHDRATDVLSFRYDGPTTCATSPKAKRRGPQHTRQVGRDGPPAHAQVVGEILISPRSASLYARGHGIPYTEELSRYVIHGLLHWLGHEDGTARQRRTMRSREDRLLTRCGVKRWTESKF